MVTHTSRCICKRKRRATAGAVPSRNSSAAKWPNLAHKLTCPLAATSGLGGPLCSLRIVHLSLSLSHSLSLTHSHLSLSLSLFLSLCHSSGCAHRSPCARPPSARHATAQLLLLPSPSSAAHASSRPLTPPLGRSRLCDDWCGADGTACAHHQLEAVVALADAVEVQRLAARLDMQRVAVAGGDGEALRGLELAHLLKRDTDLREMRGRLSVA